MFEKFFLQQHKTTFQGGVSVLIKHLIGSMVDKKKV